MNKNNFGLKWIVYRRSVCQNPQENWRDSEQELLFSLANFLLIKRKTVKFVDDVTDKTEP